MADHCPANLEFVCVSFKIWCVELDTSPQIYRPVYGLRGGMGKTAALDLSCTVVCAGQECIGISDRFVTVSDHIGPLVHCIFGFFLK